MCFIVHGQLRVCCAMKELMPNKVQRAFLAGKKSVGIGDASRRLAAAAGSSCLERWKGLGDPAHDPPLQCHGHCGDGQSLHDQREFCEPGGPCEYGVKGSVWVSRYRVAEMPLVTRYIICTHFAAAVFTGNGLNVQPGLAAERIFFPA